jgi:hypothetical protein
MSYLVYENTYLAQNCALEGSGEIFPNIPGKREISCNFYCLPWLLCWGRHYVKTFCPRLKADVGVFPLHNVGFMSHLIIGGSCITFLHVTILLAHEYVSCYM